MTQITAPVGSCCRRRPSRLRLGGSPLARAAIRRGSVQGPPVSPAYTMRRRRCAYQGRRPPRTAFRRRESGSSARTASFVDRTRRLLGTHSNHSMTRRIGRSAGGNRFSVFTACAACGPLAAGLQPLATSRGLVPAGRARVGTCSRRLGAGDPPGSRRPARATGPPTDRVTRRRRGRGAPRRRRVLARRRRKGMMLGSAPSRSGGQT